MPAGLASALVVQETENSKLFAIQCKSWAENVRLQVSKKMFRKMQFITKNESEKTGSPWMISVCDSVGIPDSKKNAFWEKIGMRTANKAMVLRRMNVTNAMKKIFKGMSHGVYCFVWVVWIVDHSQC